MEMGAHPGRASHLHRFGPPSDGGGFAGLRNPDHPRTASPPVQGVSPEKSADSLPHHRVPRPRQRPRPSARRFLGKVLSMGESSTVRRPGHRDPTIARVPPWWPARPHPGPVPCPPPRREPPPPHCLEPGPSLVRPARRGYEPRRRVSDDPFRRGGIYCRRGLGLASRAADGSRVGPLGSIEPSKDRGSHAGLGLRHVRLTGGLVLCDSTKDWQPRPCSWLVAPA
jgi:hypothetical protein